MKRVIVSILIYYFSVKDYFDYRSA